MGGAFLLSDSIAVNIRTGYRKSGTQKIYSICDGRIMLGASGIEYDGYYLARKMERQFNSIMIDEVFNDEDTFLTIFEEFIDKLHQDRNIKYKEDPVTKIKKDDEKFSYCPSIVIAVNLKNDGVQLYELIFQYIGGEKSFTIEKIMTEFTMIGSGSVVFETTFNIYRDILNNFHKPLTQDNPDLIKAVLIKTIKKVNQINLYCGGDIQIMDMNVSKGITKSIVKNNETRIYDDIIADHIFTKKTDVMKRFIDNIFN